MSARLRTKMPRRGVIRAILAGGLVLGVGAAVTLATWNDSEFATGDFSAGSFNIQGTGDDPAGSATWADHDTSESAQLLTFSVNADALSPTETVYAPFSLRVDPAKDSYAAALVANDTPVTLSGALAPYLTTATYVSDYADCVAGTPGTTVFDSATLAKDGTPQTLCMAVSLSSDDVAAQGLSGTAVWQFDATSITD